MQPAVPARATGGDGGRAPGLPREVVERARPDGRLPVLEPQRPAPQAMDLANQKGRIVVRVFPLHDAAAHGTPQAGTRSGSSGFDGLGLGSGAGSRSGGSTVGLGLRLGRSTRRLFDRLDDDRPRGAGKRHCGFAPDSAGDELGGHLEGPDGLRRERSRVPLELRPIRLQLPDTQDEPLLIDGPVRVREALPAR